MIYIRISPSLIVMVLVLLCITVTAEGSVNIVPIGDSITRGSSNDDGHSHATYRYWLWKHLQENGYDVNFVGSTDQPHLPYDFDQDHEGHSGYRAGDLLTDNHLKNWLSRYSPDIALVQLGTNDVMTGVPTDNTISSLEEIIGILRRKNPDIVILMGTVIPRDGYLEQQQTLNHAIVRLAERKNTAAAPVLAVNLFSGYDCQTDSQPSIYLHPNDNGDQKIADRYYAALLPYLSGKRKGTPTIVPTTVTPVPWSTDTSRIETEPVQNPEPQSTPSPVSAAVMTIIPIAQTQDPQPLNTAEGTGAAAASPAPRGVVCPFGESSKQYMIGDLTFQSPVSNGWQSDSTPAGFARSAGFKAWETENPELQSSEPPAASFIRWYPERREGSHFC